MFSHLDQWKKHLLKRWYIYVIGFLTVALCNIMQVISARIIGYIIDFVSGKKIPDLITGKNQEETFFFLFFIMLVSKILLTLGRFGWRITLGRETHLVSSQLKSKIWDNVRFMPMELLNRKFTKGELMNATTSDVGSARFIFGFTLVAAADVLFLSTFTMISMLMIHTHLTLYSLAILIFLPILVQKISRLESFRYEQAQEFLSSFNDLASQAISSIRLQRVTQTGDFWEKRLNKSADDYRKKRLKAVHTSLLYMPVFGIETLLAYIVLFLLGLDFVMAGKITPGDFVALQGLLVLIQDPLFELGYIISEFKKASVSLKRLDDIYQAPKLEHLTHEGNAVKDNNVPVLKMDRVSFAYPESENHVFKEMSLEIYQADRLGVIGPIGSGKSTLVQVLSGLERNIKGDVFFNGKPFNHYTHAALREYISIVSQKPFLFADSVKNNVRMGNELSDEEVWHFLELACLAEDVKKFEFGIETQLGEWGINLSGGQKQRLTLARALATKPKLLMLDDCLSAVDTVTEQRALENINSHLKETTIIWVAHRESTLKYCDRIIEMNIVEENKK